MKLLLLHAIIFISNMKSIVIHDNGGRHVRTAGSKILCQLHAAAGPTTSTYYKVFGNGNSASLTLYSARPLPSSASLPPSPLAPSRKLCPPGENALNVFAAASHEENSFLKLAATAAREDIPNESGRIWREGDRLAD